MRIALVLNLLCGEVNGMKQKNTVYSLRIVIDGQIFLCTHFFDSWEELNSVVSGLAELFSGRGNHEVSIETHNIQ